MIFHSLFITRSASHLWGLSRPGKCRLQAQSGGKRNFPHGENGSELVEMAFTLPILIGFIFGLIQVCLALYSHAYISELAREGSRYASFHGANCTDSNSKASCTATAAQIGAYVTSLGLPNLGGGKVSVDTTTANMFPDGDQVSPHRVQVKVTYIFPYKIPFVASSNLTMSSKSVMTIFQ